MIWYVLVEVSLGVLLLCVELLQYKHNTGVSYEVTDEQAKQKSNIFIINKWDHPYKGNTKNK